MDDLEYLNALKELVVAIIRQATIDYFNDYGGENSQYEFRKFCYNSQYFKYVDIDPIWYYEKCVKEKERRKEKNGKKKNWYNKVAS